MFKRYLEHRVIKEQWGYTCLLCNYASFDCSFKIIDMHINSLKHKQMMNVKDKNFIEWKSSILNLIHEITAKELVENQVAFLSNNIKAMECHICNRKSINTLANMYSHIHGMPHRIMMESLKTMGDGISTTVTSQCYNNSECNFSSLKINDENGIISKNCFISKGLCKICNHYFEDDKSLSCHVMVHILTELKFSRSVDVIQCDINTDSPTIKCLLCHTVISNCMDLKKHLLSNKHSKKIQHFSISRFTMKLNLEEDDISLDLQGSVNVNHFLNEHIQNVIHCQICNVTFIDSLLNKHESSNHHRNNTVQNTTKFSFTKTKKLSNNYLTCFICELWFDSLEKLIRHYNDNYNHKKRMYCVNTIMNSSFLNIRQKQVHCSLCNVITETCESTLNHIFGKKHKIALSLNSQKLKNENNSTKADAIVTNNQLQILIPMKNNLKEISNGTCQPNSLPPEKNYSEQNLKNMLDKLIKFDSRKSCNNKHIASSAGTQSKLNSFSVNVQKWGHIYIKYCISPGKFNIYNLDPDQDRLLKLGARLIFPVNSKKICLPCGKQIPDNKNFIYEHLQDSIHIENLKVLKASDKDFVDYPDQFSDLRLAKQFMVEVDKNWVQCYACNIAINNNDTDINLHSKLSEHTKIAQAWSESSEIIIYEFSDILENVWYYAQVFICEICKFKRDLEIDFTIHLMQSSHRAKNEKLQKCGVVTKFDFCPVCVTYWFGKAESHRLHCETSYHRRFANNGDFSVPKMSLMTIDLLEKFDIKIVNLENESNKVILEKQEEHQLLKALECTVNPIYPNAKAYTFGSRLSYLGFPDSDVDVFLDCQNKYKMISNKAEDQKIMMNVKNFFENLTEVWIIDEILLSTRVPILKLRHIPTSLKCDVSFINGLSVEKSMLVRLYNEAYHNCRLLILYLKKWLTTCKLAGSECINTFATSWLVIFYLQSKGILRSVNDLINIKNESKIVDGWECGFSNNKDDYIMPAASNSVNFNFKDHLRDFFDFYAKFDFKGFVICPYLGKALKKECFAYPESNLSSKFNIYKDRARKDAFFVFRYDSPMCIQDPVDLSQNLTKAVKKLQLRCFKTYCIESYHLIN